MTLENISHELAGLVAGLEDKVVQLRSGKRTATGFSPEKGLVVTAAHNLRDEGHIRLVDAGGGEKEVRLLGRDFRSGVTAGPCRGAGNWHRG